MIRDNMPKIGNLLLSKSTFAKLNEQLVLQQGLKNHPKMFNMLIQCLAEN
jgi:hypothetical protein